MTEILTCSTCNNSIQSTITDPKSGEVICSNWDTVIWKESKIILMRNEYCCYCWPNFEQQRHYCFIIWSFYNYYHVIFSKSIVTPNQFSTCFFDRCFKGTVTVCCSSLILLMPCSVQFMSKI
jgi:hypothetical protein